MAENDQTADAPPPGRTAAPIATGPSGALPGTLAQTPDQAAASAGASDGDEAPAIPGYEILGKLGEGGMGVVYKARQKNLNREVAIKTLGGRRVARVGLARFWAEAEVMAELKHPNVVHVIELGEHAGQPFMVMEFVSGGSLARRLRGGPLPAPAAVALVERVARGVAAAHELGIIHRDLKPDNVLLDGDAPKVADFGVAKRKSHELTQTEAMLGTPAYMAPEQADAQAKFVGPPADVWALGVILYECIAGSRPFDAGSVFDVLAKIRMDDPEPLRARAGRVPRDLQTVVAKCLTKEPELRYPTAKELADDLARFLRGEPVAARPVGVTERVVRWVRRKPTAAAAWGFSSLAVLLAVAVFVVLGFWREAEEAKTKLETANDRLTEEKKLTDAARDEAVRLKGAADGARDAAVALKTVAEQARSGEAEARLAVEYEREKLAGVEYGRTVQVAHLECLGNDQEGARLLLDGTRADRRGWEWHYVRHLCNYGLLHILKGHKQRVVAAFSPDGRLVVTASRDATLKVWRAQTGDEVLSIQTPTNVNAAAFSPDGARIVAALNDGSPRVWDADTGKESLVLRGHTAQVTCAAWSPDGSRIVTGGWDATARVWDAGTGAELLTLKGHTLVTVNVLFSHPGLSVPLGGVFSASFSADGSRIVTGNSDGTARVWDAKTGTELLALKGHRGVVTAVSFSPDGSRIITASEDGTARVWDSRPVGRTLRPPKATPSPGPRPQ